MNIEHPQGIAHHENANGHQQNGAGECAQLEDRTQRAQ